MSIEQFNKADLAPPGQPPEDDLDFDVRPILAQSTALPEDSGSMRAIHDRLAVFLALLVLAAPIPVGSNRPILWMFWGVVLGLVLIGYVIRLVQVSPDGALQTGRHKAILTLGLIILATAAIQTMPIAADLPGFLTALPVPSELAPATISLAPKTTLIAIIRLLSYAALFILVLEISGQAARTKMMGWILFFGIMTHAIWAMISLRILGDSFFWGQKVFYLGSATGTFINRNSFAAFMGVGLILGVALVLNRANRQHIRHPRRPSLLGTRNLETLFLWMCLAIVLVALTASLSRMGLAASLAGVFVTFVTMRAKIIGRLGPTMLQSAMFGIGILAVMAATFGRGLLERALFIEQNGATRGELYRQTWEMILERPFLGYGLDNFQPAFELFHKPPLHSAFTWEHAHSTYLTYWAEFGFIMGSLPILMIALVLLRLGRAIRRRSSHYAMPAAALGVVTLAALHSTIDFSFEMEANAFLFITVIAMGIAYHTKTKHGPRPGEGG